MIIALNHSILGLRALDVRPHIKNLNPTHTHTSVNVYKCTIYIKENKVKTIKHVCKYEKNPHTS